MGKYTDRHSSIIGISVLVRIATTVDRAPEQVARSTVERVEHAAVRTREHADLTGVDAVHTRVGRPDDEVFEAITIDVSRSGNRVEISVPEFTMHTAVVLEY